MKINNNFSSPAFTSTHIQKSKMNQKQINFSDRIYDAMTYSDEYQKAKEANIDVYILPNNRKKDGIKVLFLDKYSDTFIKSQGKNSRLTINDVSTSGTFDIVDKIRDNLNKIINKEIERPEQDIEKIAEGKTDLVKLRPELYEDVLEFADDYETIGMDEKDAKLQAAMTYVNLAIKFNEDDDF